MKSKNGWGFMEMIMLLGILAFFFLLAIIMIVKFYSEVDIDLSNDSSITKEKTYYELEKTLEQAANRYLDDKYENISDLNTITISKTKLENMRYIDNIDFRGCKGYVLSNIINGEFNSDAYLSCDGYKTIGFERGLDNE